MRGRRAGGAYMCKVSHLAQSYPRTYFRPTTAGPQDKAQTLEFHRHLPP